jgi:hypothetical protein
MAMSFEVDCISEELGIISRAPVFRAPPTISTPFCSFDLPDIASITAGEHA